MAMTIVAKKKVHKVDLQKPQSGVSSKPVSSEREEKRVGIHIQYTREWVPQAGIPSSRCARTNALYKRMKAYFEGTWKNVYS